MRSNVTTTQGLAWDQVAKEHLGSEFHMHEILKINWQARGVVLFSGDVTLALPAAANPGTKPTESLPPWKR